MTQATLMSIISYLQSKLISLLLAFLFLCTAVLGALLIAAQRVLFWLDGEHPQLTRASQTVGTWLSRHPKTISTSLAALLLVGGGGAFAIANLGPDIQDQPVVSITVPVKIAELEAQAQELELFEVNLTRSFATESFMPFLGITVPGDA